MMRHHPPLYRRDGTLYPKGDAGMFEWASDLSNRELKVVRQETLANDYEVSTVWLGLDHRFGRGGPPLIFETAVFWEHGLVEVLKRYSTENDAIIGHVEVVEEWTKKEKGEHQKWRE